MGDARFWQDRGWMHLHPLTAVQLTIVTGMAVAVLWSAWSIDLEGKDFGDFLRSMLGVGVLAFIVQALFTTPFTWAATVFANKNAQNHTRLMWAAHYAMMFLVGWWLGWAVFDEIFSPLFGSMQDELLEIWWYPLGNIVLCSLAANAEGARRKQRQGADRRVDAGLA